MLSPAQITVLSALVSSLTPGNVTINELLQCMNPEAPPILPNGGDTLLPPLPQNDFNLIRLLSLDWPRKDSEWHLQEYNSLFQEGGKRTRTLAKGIPSDMSLPDTVSLFKFISRHDLENTTSMIEKKSDSFIQRAIEESINEGEVALEKKLENDGLLAAKGDQIPVDSPSGRHQRGFRKTDPMSTKLAQTGFKVDMATMKLKQRLNLGNDITALASINRAAIPCDTNETRPVPEPCEADARYRRLDGTCNNLQNPLWGASFTSFRRAMMPDYGDGVASFRLAKNGKSLPSARLVSTSVNVKPNDHSTALSSLTIFYAQFVDHDLTLAPLSKITHPTMGDISIKCCDDGKGSNAQRSPECAPIDIPKNDTFFSDFKQTCMEFVRSAPAPRCTFGPREQLNELTAYLDGSVIYNTHDTTPSLRAYKDGLMETHITKDGVELLPHSQAEDDECFVKEHANRGEYCFRAGDVRVNENSMLTLFQTVWAREHNRVARQMKAFNPLLNDETLFQETRRIVVAEFQHITYKEYLPNIFGPWLMEALELNPLKDDQYTTDYDPEINPDISNVFGAAAYRFGHSLLGDQYHTITNTGGVGASSLPSMFFNPFPLYKKGSDASLARGLVNQFARKVDIYFTEAITNNLFKGHGKFGLDLIALNIQRARDHGVPGYNTWRELCLLPKVTKFIHLLSEIDYEIVTTLTKIYNHVDDIDVFIGGLAERPLTGSIMGPTFTCILGDQFLRMKRGDRYWYENENMPGGAFTPPQMKELHSVSLARVMCDNIPELLSIQEFPLRQVGPDNIRRLCDDPRGFPVLNLALWKEDLLNRTSSA